MNNETKTIEISNETYNGYRIRVSNLNDGGRASFCIHIATQKSLTLREKYPSRFYRGAGQYEFAHNLEQAEAYVAKIKARIDEKVSAKQSRVAENAKAREEFVNPYKAGDILYSHWGYEQTNREFYQVVAVGSRSLKLREIGSVSVRSTSWCSDECSPVKDKFLDEEIHRVNIVVRSYGDGKVGHSIKSPVHGHLHDYKGGTLHRSWGY